MKYIVKSYSSCSSWVQQTSGQLISVSTGREQFTQVPHYGLHYLSKKRMPFTQSTFPPFTRLHCNMRYFFAFILPVRAFSVVPLFSFALALRGKWVARWIKMAINITDKTATAVIRNSSALHRFRLKHRPKTEQWQRYPSPCWLRIVAIEMLLLRSPFNPLILWMAFFRFTLTPSYTSKKEKR